MPGQSDRKSPHLRGRPWRLLLLLLFKPSARLQPRDDDGGVIELLAVVQDHDGDLAVGAELNLPLGQGVDLHGRVGDLRHGALLVD